MNGHRLRIFLVFLALAILGLIVHMAVSQPLGGWSVVAASLQGLATIALVWVTTVYAGLVEEQTEAAQESAEASKESVDHLVERDVRRELKNLRTIRLAMTSLASEAQRWDDRTGLISLAKQNGLPDDNFEPEHIRSVQDGAASLGGEIQESVWRAIESARDAKHSLDVLRGWGGSAKGGKAKDEVKKFGRALSDVKEQARIAAAAAECDADELQSLLS